MTSINGWEFDEQDLWSLVRYIWNSKWRRGKVKYDHRLGVWEFRNLVVCLVQSLEQRDKMKIILDSEESKIRENKIREF